MERRSEPARWLSLRWRMAAAPLGCLLVAILGVAIAAERLAADAARRNTQQRLLAVRDRAVFALRDQADATRASLSALASDPRTVTAFKRLRRATRDLDAHPPGGRSIVQARNAVRDHLRRYYADELRRGVLRLESLLVPQTSAIWLQSVFLARSAVDSGQARSPGQGGLYEAENEMWQPIFEQLFERFAWQDLFFADVEDGRVLYSVAKTSVFQTSLLEGPYAESALGSLFRELADERWEQTRLTDLLPFVPAHGASVSFAGAPIFDDATQIGVLLVQEDPNRLDRILSAGGHWSAAGLGETGDLFIVGSDGRMRSRSRFFEQLRSMNPQSERQGVHVAAFSAESVLEPDDSSPIPSRYINHRQVPVFGTAKRVEIEELPWTVIAEIEEAEALASLGSVRDSLGSIVLGLLLLGGITIVLATTSMLRPEAQILETLRAVQSGNPDARVPQPAVAKLGGLGSAVNELLDSHADWVAQEVAERQARESEAHELVSVLSSLARGDLARRARVDGHLAALAHAVNALGSSMGHLTERLVLPPRVAETAHGIQTVTDQILPDTDKQQGDLSVAAAAAGEMLDWLRGCVVDSQGVVDAASRVELLGQPLEAGTNGQGAAHVSPQHSGIGSQKGARSGDEVATIAARYRRLRAAVDEGKRLQDAIRNAVDGARRIRTGAEALHGHAQTLQRLALDMHALADDGRKLDPNEARGAGTEGAGAAAPSIDLRD